jgi:hypothetical protein
MMLDIYFFALNFPGESAMVQRAIPRKTRNKNAKKYNAWNEFWKRSFSPWQSMDSPICKKALDYAQVAFPPIGKRVSCSDAGIVARLMLNCSKNAWFSFQAAVLWSNPSKLLQRLFANRSSS